MNELIETIRLSMIYLFTEANLVEVILIFCTALGAAVIIRAALLYVIESIQKSIDESKSKDEELIEDSKDEVVYKHAVKE